MQKLEMLADLQQPDEAVGDFPTIKKAHPEKADKLQTADLLLPTNSEKSISVMMKKGWCDLQT